MMSIHYILLLLSLMVMYAKTEEDLSATTVIQSNYIRGLKTYRSNPNGDKFYLHYSYLDPPLLYIGGMEHVHLLNLDDITSNPRQSPRLVADSLSTGLCERRVKDNAAYRCKNHIRSIYRHGNELMICGTGSLKPELITLRLNGNDFESNQDVTPSIHSGDGSCPDDPDIRPASVHVDSGTPDNILRAFIGIGSSSDDMINKPAMGGDVRIRTFQDDPKWLKDPTFVKAVSHGDHVYFFFVEELPNDASSVVSRVARVCKNDRSNVQSTGFFTSYFKTELSCTLPGSPEFKLNHLRDVQLIGDKIYGLFTADVLDGLQTYLTGKQRESASAVCEFAFEGLGSVQQAFNGDFKGRTAAIPDPHPASQCAQNSRDLPEHTINFLLDHPEMARSVSSNPSVFIPNSSYRLMVVDVVRGNTVFFLTTETGEIAKVVDIDGIGTHKLLAIYQPFDEETTIHSMELYDDNLYVISDEAVKMIPKKQCSNYEERCDKCVVDPYCGYDEYLCKEYRNGFLQNVQQDGFRTCNNGFCKTPENRRMHQKLVRIEGDGVQLSCDSLCEVKGERVWTRRNREPLPVKHALTKTGELVMLDLTQDDGGVYSCSVDGVMLAEYNVTVPRCNSESDCFKEEFRRYCDEFQRYANEMASYQCIKGKCTSCETCGVDTHNECPVR